MLYLAFETLPVQTCSWRRSAPNSATEQSATIGQEREMELSGVEGSERSSRYDVRTPRLPVLLFPLTVPLARRIERGKSHRRAPHLSMEQPKRARVVEEPSPDENGRSNVLRAGFTEDASPEYRPDVSMSNPNQWQFPQSPGAPAGRSRP